MVGIQKVLLWNDYELPIKGDSQSFPHSHQEYNPSCELFNVILWIKNKKLGIFHSCSYS